jgi:adenine-specific DNA-methyltransferase
MSRVAEPYLHTQETPMRPEVGTQAQFKKRKAPKTYRYDSSLDPALSWDDGASRTIGEWLLGLIVEASKLPSPHRFSEPKRFLGAGNAVLMTVNSLGDAVAELQGLGKPFLDWAGKAERLSMDVPTLPLFIHERLSTQAILQTLKGHKREGVDQQASLFGDPGRPLAERMKPYEHRDKWVNRMVLGDSLVVMNSLLEYEGMGGQVQMIYMDPPYGVKFGSNFQPFVRKRDVKNNDDADLTREPEMVQAYRDTWELGLHSYLTYLRDRLTVARDLLTPSGSVFVQISDENLHHVREVMDEVFGPDNFVSVIMFAKTSGLASADSLATTCDYLLWYAKDRKQIKYRQLFDNRKEDGRQNSPYSFVELANGERRSITRDEKDGTSSLPDGARVFRIGDLTKPGPGSRFDFEYEGRVYSPGKRWWGTTPEGLAGLARARRLSAVGNGIYYVRYADDFGLQPLQNLWGDTATGGFVEEKFYVVQTNSKVIARCLLERVS